MFLFWPKQIFDLERINEETTFRLTPTRSFVTKCTSFQIALRGGLAWPITSPHLSTIGGENKNTNSDVKIIS